MKKLLLTVLLPVIFFSCLRTAQEPEPTPHDLKMEWWRDAKFGMFIHWGPYALWGGEYHGHRQRRGGAEWIMNRCKIPVEEYSRMAAGFNPSNYDPERWVLMAKAAGMKYIVMTSKHHDGFAMFKSEASAFNVVDHSAYNRDVVAMLADACRRHDMKLGFYYSQAQDWTNPGGSTARKEMHEGWANPDSVRIDAYTAVHRGSWDSAQQTATMDEYIEKVSLPQVRELLTNYGDIAVIWWDTPVGMTDEYAARFAAELERYPQVIQNDRLKRPNYPGDYKTPEGLVPKPEDIEGVDWETCMNIGSSWGYKSWEENWKPAEVIIRNLITIAARGGNYLLNVGPDPDGIIPPEAVERLEAVGRWMDVNGEAIHGTRRSGIYPDWGECIRKDGRKRTTLYLAVFDWPEDGLLHFECGYPASKATLLQTGRRLPLRSDGTALAIEVPRDMPDTVATVIRLELKDRLPAQQIVSNTEKTFRIMDL
ncbi:MAG: alpha-L-fucosidase [Alistipes sp.]|nr:alpha-L-fucosidase [Alistipes sp.]